MRARGLVALMLCVGLTGCGARQPGQSDENTSTSTSVKEGADQARVTADPSAAEAVAVAVRFVCSGQRLLDTPPTQLAEVIRSLWSASKADDAVTATVEQLAELRDRLGAGTGPTRFRQSVLATRTDQASDARVTVSVWWIGVLSREGAVLPQAAWTTSSITLVSEAGTWRVEAESSESGPTPDQNSDSAPIAHDEFERRLAGFVDWESNR